MKAVTLFVLYDLGDLVYLKSDVRQMPHTVIEYSYDGTIIKYVLQSGGYCEVLTCYAHELSAKRNHALVKEHGYSEEEGEE